MGEGRASRSITEFTTQDVSDVPTPATTDPAGQVSSTLDPRPQEDGGSELNAEEFGDELSGTPETPRP